MANNELNHYILTFPRPLYILGSPAQSGELLIAYQGRTRGITLRLVYLYQAGKNPIVDCLYILDFNLLSPLTLCSSLVYFLNISLLIINILT